MARLQVTSMVTAALTMLVLASTVRAGLLATIHLKQYGDLGIELFPDAAPKTVANFVQLARSGFYNGTEFYRHSPNFVIQGGALDNASNDTVPLEYDIPNTQYTVGLARAAAPNTGSSEFFINLQNNTEILEPNAQGGGYAVFGTLVSGFSVLNVLVALPIHVSKEYGMHFFDSPPIIESISITIQ
jgi:peptidyl-prolyl cis-trans isomerase A (cyclophilin A)